MGLNPDLPRTTERLLLRVHRRDDLEDLVRFHGDPEVVRFIPWPQRDRAATGHALEVKLGQGALDEPGQWLVLAIEVRSTGRVVGEVLLKWDSETDRSGELGFALARDAQGQGYAAEASREVLRMAFDELGLHRVVAICIEQNHGSARLLQRLGFRREGRMVDSAFHKGGWVTQLMYALTEDEWRSPVRTDADDVLDVVRRFLAAFTSGGEHVDDLHEVMLPEAVVVRTCGALQVYDVEAFVEPRRALLTDGSLTGFREWALHGRVEVFGDVASWFGSYAKDGMLHGEPCPGLGMKSVQLVRTDAGWRISAVAWDDVRPGVAADDHLARDLLA